MDDANYSNKTGVWVLLLCLRLSRETHTHQNRRCNPLEQRSWLLCEKGEKRMLTHIGHKTYVQTSSRG